jgi:hypothetical protein
MDMVVVFISLQLRNRILNKVMATAKPGSENTFTISQLNAQFFSVAFVLLHGLFMTSPIEKYQNSLE